MSGWREALRFRVWAPFRADRHHGMYLSHSQFGEDMVLRGLFEGQRRGFYVDLGAHHPVYLSNTYRLYRTGWRGLVVDALPGFSEAFRRLRPRDLAVERCLGAVDGQKVTFVVRPNVPTSGVVRAGPAPEDGRRVTVETSRLATLLDAHLPSGQEIDLMTIDLEGADEDVLRTNDWDRWRPRVLVLEQMGTVDELVLTELHRWLRTLGYALIARTGHSSIYDRAS